MKKLYFLSMLLLTAFSFGIFPAHAEGGNGGSGQTSIQSSGVVAYSNFGNVTPSSSGNGWALVGLQNSGFFSYFAEQFTPTLTGTVTEITLPIHQYDTGGNGSFAFQIFTDSNNTLGIMIGAYSGQSAKGSSTALTTIKVSNGAKLLTGQNYWAKVVPSSQSREVWVLNSGSVYGNQYYVDPYQETYTANQLQGAFQIKVLQ